MSKTNEIELLAPAGGMDQLKCAVNFGANAVYMAGKAFGMRAKASNFDYDEIAQAVEYAHKNNVSVYVTCNVLMHEDNLESLKDHFIKLDQAGVDAFIVGDLGAMSIGKQVAPNVDIHISTQASVANSAAAIEYVKLGAKRIILAREMSLEDIKKMRKNLNAKGYESVELEAFVHGAMCMSVSGRCLISSYLTGRSANKGLCTQPCRWSYTLNEEKRPGQNFEMTEDQSGTYIMNSMDMNMIEHLDDLKEAGLTSIKIEGRNKKALYVATVINAYRHVLDGDDKEKWAAELDNVSHRPYSTGFYYGAAKQSPDYDGYEQNCVHCADVVDFKNGDTSRTYLKCRNRFEVDQELQAIVPGGAIITFKITDLK